jgi:hypothetical protein
MLEENCWNKKEFILWRGMLRKETHCQPPPPLMWNTAFKSYIQKWTRFHIDNKPKIRVFNIWLHYLYILIQISAWNVKKTREENQILESMEHDFRENNGIWCGPKQNKVSWKELHTSLQLGPLSKKLPLKIKIPNGK